MKILYISSNPTLSTSQATGATTHIISVIKGLQKLGIQIESLIAGDKYLTAQNKPSILANIWNLFPLTIRTLRRDIFLLIHDYLWTQKAIRVAASFQPDIIYERSAFLHTSGIRISKKLNIPILIEVNNPVSEIKLIDGSLLLPIALYIEKRNLLSAHAIVTISEAMKDYLVHRGADAAKIYVIHNATGPPVNKLNSYNASKKSDSNIIIGHLGSFAIWQKIDILIRAYAFAKKSYPKLGLFLIGDGPLRKNFEFLVQKLNLSDSVIFIGRKTRREVSDILANEVDIAVCSSDTWYGSPTKIFEYGAAGKPVIAFRTPALLEIIEDGKTGLLVSSRASDELGLAIIRLIENPDLRFRLAENWQRKVLEEHIWDLVVLKTLDICKKVLNKT